LFEPGADFLLARNRREMTGHLQDVLHDQSLASGLARHGLETIRARHTCGHRVDELLAIYSGLAERKTAKTEPTLI
jgi:spore maturation protein CgeB